MATRSFENPLIPHARMRDLYRAMVEVRALRPHLPSALRIGRNQEACFVAAAIGLAPGDLTGASALEPVLAYIRKAAQTTRQKLGALLAATAPAFGSLPQERLLLAVGQAMAVAQFKQGPVVLAFAAADALSSAEWLRMLRLIAAADLPLVIVVLPAAKASAASPDFTALAARAGSNLPVLPVEASDALALYRVAQECLGRARARGGPALVECVPSSVDPITLLAEQMLARRIHTSASLAAVAARCGALLPAPTRAARQQLH